MPSQPGLLLLTGGTGHIGFATLLHALTHTSHAIRLAVRSIPTAEDLILTNPSILALNLPRHRITFTSVPDITVPGAYTTALIGVTHVIHIASPIPSAHLGAALDELDDIFIKPAVQGTVSLLEACKAQSPATLQRVVLLSSVIATMPAPHWACLQRVPAGTVYEPESRTEAPEAPYRALPMAYAASKVRALAAAEEWVGRERPGWSTVAVYPAWVIGRDESKRDLKGVRSGTNNLLVRLVVDGVKEEMPKAGSAVSVRDVGRVCVGALGEDVVVQKGRIRGFMAGRRVVWQDAVSVCEKEFKKEVDSGVLSREGEQETWEVPVDASETEKVFGFKFEEWEEMVRSVVGHYVEVCGKGGGK